MESSKTKEKLEEIIDDEFLTIARNIERNDSQEPPHENIAKKVFRRLMLRHAQITIFTELTKNHLPEITKIDLEKSVCIEKDKIKSVVNNPTPQIKGEGSMTIVNINTCEANSGNKNEIEVSNDNYEIKTDNNLDSIAYRLAITDLFVEKALAYLEEKAEKYNGKAERAYLICLIIILIGVGFAAASYIITFCNEDFKPEVVQLISRFTVAFTFYGMLVLAAVGLWRYGRALMDQAERLLEKRHALRQGRLFVHLKNGNLNIEDMERAFRWNTSQENAFTNMLADAKAPWGAVASDLIKATPNIMEKTAEIMKSRSNEKIKK